MAQLARRLVATQTAWSFRDERPIAGGIVGTYDLGRGTDLVVNSRSALKDQG